MKFALHFLSLGLIGGILFSCDQKGGGDIVPAKTVKPNPIILSPNMSDAVNAYKDWKENFVTTNGCPEGGRRVLFDDGVSTVSEGIGYGMLAAAYLKDQDVLDGLLTYYDAHLDNRGLMHWKINESGGILGSNAATDADEDIAIALIVAHKTWGDSGKVAYLTKAKNIISLLMKYTVEPSTFVLKPGDAWGGSNTTNPSYYAPGYYKVFYEITKDSSWLLVADKCYEILGKAMNPSTGLVPDWCMASGSTPAANVTWATMNGTVYSYDACRTPWRIATDYAWYRDERAKSYCEKISAFVSTQNPTSIVDGYYLNGQRYSNNPSSAFLGPFGCAIIALQRSDANLVNSFYTENVNYGTGSYYNSSMRLLTLLFQTSNWEKP